MKSYLNNNFDTQKWAYYIDELSVWSAPFGLKLLNFIDYKPNIAAIDIGFGAGFPLIEIAMRLGEGSVVYGIDPWKEAINKTEEKINYYGISNVKIIEGMAESIPLGNNSVNLITSNNGINNVEDIDKVLIECSRILNTGGQFIQTMNLEKSMFEFYDQLENVLSELNLKAEIEIMYQHIEEKRPSIDKILKIMKRENFIIKDIEYDHFDYKFSNGTAMFNHYFIRLAFMNSWIKILPKERVNEIFGIIETRLNKQAELFGGIKLSIPFVLINSIKNHDLSN
jgi:ubiquinone/menaquinone biosynthesis C-methylase UbiE